MSAQMPFTTRTDAAIPMSERSENELPLHRQAARFRRTRSARLACSKTWDFVRAALCKTRCGTLSMDFHLPDARRPLLPRSAALAGVPLPYFERSSPRRVGRTRGVHFDGVPKYSGDSAA